MSRTISSTVLCIATVLSFLHATTCIVAAAAADTPAVEAFLLDLVGEWEFSLLECTSSAPYNKSTVNFTKNFAAANGDAAAAANEGEGSAASSIAAAGNFESVTMVAPDGKLTLTLQPFIAPPSSGEKKSKASAREEQDEESGRGDGLLFTVTAPGLDSPLIGRCNHLHQVSAGVKVCRSTAASVRDNNEGLISSSASLILANNTLMISFDHQVDKQQKKAAAGPVRLIPTKSAAEALSEEEEAAGAKKKKKILKKKHEMDEESEKDEAKKKKKATKKKKEIASDDDDEEQPEDEEVDCSTVVLHLRRNEPDKLSFWEKNMMMIMFMGGFMVFRIYNGYQKVQTRLQAQ